MENLSKVLNEIEELKKEYNSELAELEIEAIREFKLLMKAPAHAKTIEDSIKALDKSTKLTDVEGDEWVHRWTRFDANELIDTDNPQLVTLLRDYFRDEHNIDLDIKNDVISTAVGPCIAIDDEGYVYDQNSQKTILTELDYVDNADRNAKIKEYMEKTGYYPSIIKFGRYGVEGYVKI